MNPEKTSIDKTRIVVLTAAELFDAWRTVPRALVVGYGWLCWTIVEWYMNLKPYLIDGCDIALYNEMCIVEAPTTQHAALVTAIVGCAAAVFGLYTNGGRAWSKEKFARWDDTYTQQESKRQYEMRSPHKPRNHRGRFSENSEYSNNFDEGFDEGFDQPPSDYEFPEN